MEWIRFNERQPEFDTWIIVGSAIHATVTVGIFDGDEVLNPDLEYMPIKGVTHWMHLPEPPEED